MKLFQTPFDRRIPVIFSALFLISGFMSSCSKVQEEKPVISKAATLAGVSDDKTRRFGEPFGVAVDKQGVLYVSDGEEGKIRRVFDNERFEVVTDKLNTPSGLAFDKEGFLIVADAGSHTIKRVNAANGETTTLAGVENKSGFADGDAGQSLFNAPVGVTIAEDGKIYVADTYNDKIRLIENGKVTTLAGSGRGFADSEQGGGAKFDTPCGVAVLKDGSLIIADTGNRRLRRVESTGRVTTLAGNGAPDLIDGFPFQARFVEPTAVTVEKDGAVYIADGNAIRVIGRRFFPWVETLSDPKRGFTDGDLRKSRFNRPSGLALDQKGNLFVADAENRAVRVLSNGQAGGIEISPEKVEKMKFTPEEFRALQPPRWCYDPPDRKREVAGTMGEIRGEIKDSSSQVWFHNGLDIAGGYGETARFVRTEKVLKPLAAENFGNLRELVRLPTMGYIHIRLGRDSADKPFGDGRFQFSRAENGKLNGVRIPRGARFAAGEPIGTLNAFNHVHLIAGRAGAEMNAIDALVLPNNSDSVLPKIEKVTVFDENWQPLETEKGNSRINLRGKTRIVVTAYDQMDGNAARRRLGVYELGYQVLKADKTPLFEPKTTISFQKMPDMDFAKIVYAVGSKSGYTPDTVFNYIVTNEVNGDAARENFLDPAQFEAGSYILRVFARDFFGNTANQDVFIEIIK